MKDNEYPYSFDNVLKYANRNFGLILAVMLFFLGGFAMGSMWTENQSLKGGNVAGTTAQAGNTVPTAPSDEGPTAEQLANAAEVSSEDHIRGNTNAKVVLVEYSDFECPYCQGFHETMVRIKEEYGNDVAWVYRHYPLSFHPNAQAAAEVSECIAEQGGNDGFWAYADAVFAKQGELGGRLTPEAINEAIITAGYNPDAINDCVDSGQMESIVTDEFSNGSIAGVTGTPGTIVVTADGPQELIPGALPYESVKAIVEKYL